MWTLLLLTVITTCPVKIVGQCPITNVTIGLSVDFDDNVPLELADRSNLELVIEGITTGGKAKSVTWKLNNTIVNRNTVIPGGGFYDGGGENIVDTGPCESQKYRVALQVTGYLPGNYTYTVSNSNIPTLVTSPVFSIQDPGPPSNLVLTQITDLRVQATWTPPAGFPDVKYRVYVNAANVNMGGTEVTGTTYIISTFGLCNSNTIHVRATTGTYLSVPAVSSIFIRDVFPPVISVSSVNATSATLSFSQPTDSLSVDMYTATLSSTTCTGVPTRTESTITNSVIIGNLEPGIHYSVSVVARHNMTGLTGTSTTTLTTEIKFFSRVISSTIVVLQWSPVGCATANQSLTGYVVNYGSNFNPHTKVFSNSTANRYAVAGLLPFTVYSFQVAGLCGEDIGEYSHVIRLITAEDRPTKILNLTATPRVNSVNVNWTEPSPSNGIINNYFISYSVNGSVTTSYTSTSTNFTILDLDSGTVVSQITVSASTRAGSGPPVTLNYTVTTLFAPYDCFTTTSGIKLGQNLPTMSSTCSAAQVRNDIFESTLQLLWREFQVSPQGRVENCPVRSCDEVSQTGWYWIQKGTEVVQKFCLK